MLTSFDMPAVSAQSVKISDVRLDGGSSRNNGTLQLLIPVGWQTYCGTQSSRFASVICRMLGYNTNGISYSGKISYTLQPNSCVQYISIAFMTNPHVHKSHTIQLLTILFCHYTMQKEPDLLVIIQYIISTVMEMRLL